jgi:hypothetical protein
VIVAESGRLAAGLAIDEVDGVGDMAEPTEDTDSELLAGALLDEGDLVGLIDVPSVFAELGCAAR